MKYIDKRSNLFICDSSINPLNHEIPNIDDIKKDFNSFILSASGWRKIFAISKDEEDATEEISINDKYLCALIALSLAKYMNCITDNEINNKEIINRNKKVKIVIGMDARPTGVKILDIINRVFLSLNIEVINTFISAAPEIMALSSSDKTINAFLYISASHNPIGHNGIKFGIDGGVFNKDQVQKLISIFTEFSQNKKALEFVKECVTNLNIETLESSLNNIEINKEISLKNYRTFALSTASRNQDITTYLDNLKSTLSKNKISLVAELNGSARTLSIDKTFFAELGINALTVNDKPREVVHAIVPEGENLEMCRTILEEKYKEDNSFIVGYVPDNDGDRGNLVYIKESTKEAKILQAQEVFALVAMAELSSMRYHYPESKIAISVNGPTSMRIDDIAKALDVEVFRAEVGEANVVGRAQIQRDLGYIVRIFGEGSNGGNITHPAKVRDPLNTILSLINLLTNKEIFNFYCERVNYNNKTLSIENFINSLPVYTTTDAFSKDAKIQIKSDHGILKENYENLFINFFNDNKEELYNKFNISKYRVFQMEGSNCIEGMGKEFRNYPYKGGYKVVFQDSENKNLAYIWMRGSGTEAVFRLLVDVKGNNIELYNYLLKTHTELLLKADK